LYVTLETRQQKVFIPEDQHGNGKIKYRSEGLSHWRYKCRYSLFKWRPPIDHQPV